jgi:hypothetical protein
MQGEYVFVKLRNNVKVDIKNRTVLYELMRVSSMKPYDVIVYVGIFTFIRSVLH